MGAIESVIAGAGVCAGLIWGALLLAPWRPWATSESLERDARSDAELSDVTALIPARDEAAVIERCVRSVAGQGRGLNIVVVDDQSTDETVARARQATEHRLCVVAGRPLPAGWSGKLWALEQARAHVQTPLTLLVDADIELDPGIVGAARAKLNRDDLGLVSVMVEPGMSGWWERWLMPAFVYFFKLLYPFRLSNAPGSSVAAAAGGFVLVRTHLLQEIGGFAALRDALIDDCALARAVKRQRQRTWIGLTRSARSLRANVGLAGIWAMVARSAYTQLGYSPALLAACTLVMALAFAAPVLALAAPTSGVRALGGATLAAMMLSYAPTLAYYGRTRGWALSLPIVGMLYLFMTWSSAAHYHRGVRAQWKRRIYKRGCGPV